MTMQVEVYKGKKVDEIIAKLQEEFEGNYQILDQKTIKRIPIFPWIKEYEVKVAISQPEILKKEMMKKQVPKKQMDSNQEILLALLEGKETEEKIIKKEEVAPPSDTNKELESVKKMMEEMMGKISEKEKVENKPFLGEDNEKVLLKYYTEMLSSEVEEEVARKIIQETKLSIGTLDLMNKELVEKTIISKITNMMKVTGPFDVEKTKTIALIGPTGVGKTTTLAKIAAILKAENKRIGLISTDVYRIGAIEQLQTYANIMDSKMIAATSPQELKDAIDYFKNVEKVDQILIDTVGRSPMKTESIDVTKEYLDISQPDHTVLVLSSTQKYKDMLQIIKNFETIDIDSLIFTKLDETMSYGFILNVLAKSGLNVSYVTNGQNVPRDIYSATSESLAKKILNGDDEFGSGVVTA